MFKIGLYGAGKIGLELEPILSRFGLLRCFIDGDIARQKVGVNGIEVVEIAEFLKKYPEDRIVIASTAYSDEIERELCKRGLKNRVNYWRYYEFKGKILHRLLFEEFKVLYVELAQICITERCTLKCKKCAHACNKVPMNRGDMSLKEIKRSADCFFGTVDLVGEFVLIGGEPFLNKNIADAIEYVGENYRDKIIVFAITTNGTIIPNDTIKEKCKKYGIKIRVSDYSDTLPQLSSRYELLYENTKELDVTVWKTNRKDAWYDYGFAETDNGDDPEVLKKVFAGCKTPCREIRGSKYYYCVMARSINDNLNMNLQDNDYYELDDGSTREGFLQYELSGPEKGYLDMCRYCRGALAEKFRIPAAEQEC